MPEGSDLEVRAEIQIDKDLFSSPTHYCIMVGRQTTAQLCDDYNSSGGSDSEQDSSVWDRNPRNGHPRGPVKASIDLHGAQEGIRHRSKTLGLYRQDRGLSKSSQEREERRQALSLQTQKCKLRKRRKSSSEHETEKDGWKSGFKQMEGGAQHQEEMKGRKLQLEQMENEKSMKNWEKRKPVEQPKDEEAMKKQGSGKIKDNKELYESSEEKFEKCDEVREVFSDKEQKYNKYGSIVEDVADNEMKKSIEDSISVKMYAFENDQTAMLDKQKLKKIDIKAVEKMDQEKEVTAKQKNTEKDEARIQQDVRKRRQKDEAKWKFLMGEIDSRSEVLFQKENKLVVNMEQGRHRQKYVGKLGLILDNKKLDSMEKLKDADQTHLKEILDPQCDTETEKQDVSKESSQIGTELSTTDKESSLGFEVECSPDELEDPQFSSIFPNLKSATKLWEQSQKECETCTSIDENSFSFPSECHASTDTLLSIHSMGKEPWDVGQLYSVCNRFVYNQDSNKHNYDLENIFRQYSCMEREAFSKQTKSRIQDTIDSKSNKELDTEESEEKFKKEEKDICDEKDESKDDRGNEKLDNDVEKSFDGVDAGEDNVYGDVTDDCPEVNDPLDQEDTDLMDCSQMIQEENTKNTDGDKDGNDDNANTETEEEVVCIIDAEEKDVSEKETIDAGEKSTASIEKKKEDIDNQSANTVTMDGAPASFLLANDADADDIDIETREVHYRGMLEGTRGSKKICCSRRVRKREKKKKFLHKKPDIWKKMKRTPKPALPKEKEVDGLAPRKNWNGRRYSMFCHGEFGRRCSTNTGGGSGSSGRNDTSGGNSNSDQRNNGDKNSKNRRNQNNKDRGNNDRNNSNNNQTQSDSILDRETEPEVIDTPETARGLADVIVPPADYKAYRKKHTDLDNFDWLEILGRAIEEKCGPIVDIFLKLMNGENLCLVERLHHPEELSDDALQCSICLTVDSLLKHYAHCLSVFNSCSMCVKIFSLICSHVADCVNNPLSVCEIRICKAIRVLTGSDISSHMKTLWFQVRKKLARIIDDAEDDRVEQPSHPDEGRTRRVSKVSGSFSGPLPSIPEGTPLSITSTSRSGSRVLRRKKSNLTNVEESEQSGVSEEEGSSSSPVVNAAAGAQGVEDEEQSAEEDVDSKHGLYSRPEIPDEADAIPTSSEEGSVESTGSGSTDGSGQFGVMTAASRFTSLPMGPPGHGEPYFPSFKDKPTGKKGIGEVVYASKHQLVVVVTVWEKFKTQYLIEAKLARHYTEEGVILPDFKSKLHIKGLRYQNEFQWVKVAHLGNGMTGKCHLAMDFETEFKFCVKEIHISNYEKEEIELWSELDHTHVVQVYGAIRHGEKIYILQEFIEGGCLTEAINIQRKLGRRLSQLTALRYFQQLLQVLKYLKSRNILHEDLKADNILLNKTSEGVSIKVADFGLARRCQGIVRGGTKPVGTQTQWSPEKAEARVGYGFAAEIWAAVCVLVHMLSGQPPWVRRYESFKALIVVIVEKSPPMEDIPRNIHESIKDLIRRGFTVCQGQRPTAEDLLMHSAFRLLDEAPVLHSTSGIYSILESVHFESPTNRIDDDPNADLREIYRNLERESVAGATAAGNGARRKEQRASSIVNVHGEEVPYYSKDYRVYTVSDKGRDGRKPEISQSPEGQGTDNGDKPKNQPDNMVSVNIYMRSRMPSHPDDNIDPMAHIDRFYNDLADQAVPPQAQPNLVMYHPNLESIGSQKGNSSSRESSLENLSSGTIKGRLIPIFEKILPGEEVPDIAIYPSDEEVKEENILENFDFEKNVEHVRKNFTLPTVIDASADLSPGSRLPSEQGSSSLGVSAERSANGGQTFENLVQEEKQQTESETATTKQLKSGPPSVYSVIGDDRLPSINDDDLFRSGSPPKFNPEMFTHPHGQGQFSTIQEIPEASSFLQRNEGFLGGGDTGHQMITPGRPRLAGSSLPPPLEHVPKSNKMLGLPHTAPAYSMQNYVTSCSDGYHSPRASPALDTREIRHFPAGGTSPRQRPPEQGSRHSRPDTYILEQNWLHLHQPGQQRVVVQNQPPRQLNPNQPLQYLTHSQNPVNTASLGMSSAGGILPHDGLRTSPRQYSSSQNTAVSSHQFYQHGQGQINVQGQGQQNLRGQDYARPPTSASSYQGGNFPNNFQGYRQRMPVHDQYLLRSEIQREDLNTTEHVNPHQYTNQPGLISMPNQYGGQQYAPADPLSLNPPHFNPYQTSTPRSDGYHNGARPKVPLQQQPKQLFPGTDSQSFLYGRRNPAPPTSVDLKINDPRKVYEQSIVGPPGRVGQYPVYPTQPKTPILNPVINPRPVTPQEGQRMDLRLDISRAQQAHETPALSHVQTAPVFSPPKTPKKSPDLHRTMSQVPIVRKSPSLVGVMSASPSNKDDRMSSSASKSQFEEQDDAFRELGRTAEAALSQHSDPAERIFFTNYDDDIDEEIKGEIHVDDSYLENPAESLAHLLDPVQDNSVTVTFRSNVNGKEFGMKFSPKHTSKYWEKIIKEELDGFSRVSISNYGLQRFCLRRQDGSSIDLESCLGNVNCTVIMVEATDNDPWWIEGGMISK